MPCMLKWAPLHLIEEKERLWIPQGGLSQHPTGDGGRLTFFLWDIVIGIQCILATWSFVSLKTCRKSEPQSTI